MKQKSRRLKIRHKQTRNKRNKRGGNKELISQSLQNREENLTIILQTYCKNPDNCLALGHYGDYIKRFFNDFRTFAYVNPSKIKRIGNPSVNGFIIEIPFTKNGYTAYTVLKSSAKQTADNLFFEYLVGKRFVNKVNKIVPVFLETYDLYQYKDDASYDAVVNAVNTNTLQSIDLGAMLQRMNFNPENMNSKQLSIAASNSCTRNKQLCILIQHFDNFVSLGSQFKSQELYKEFRGDLFSVLFQVYFALNMFKDVYTHYDLHTNNVMLYKPFEGKKCILMRYHLADKVYEFKTEYIPKIIDYGRNYFDDSILNSGKNTLNSYQFIKNICYAPKCNPECGKNFGYRFIRGSEAIDVDDMLEEEVEEYLESISWLDPTEPNESHDLRLAAIIFDKLSINNKKVDILYRGNYGTPYEPSRYGDDKIRNIMDMFAYLKKGVMPYYNKIGKYTTGWETVATLDVYDSTPYRPYEFNLLPDTSLNRTVTVSASSGDTLTGKKRRLEDTVIDENTNKMAKI